MAYSVLSSVRAIDLDVRYALVDKSLDISVSSSLDKSLKDGFLRYIKDQEGVYKAQIQEELKKRLDNYIAENEIAQKGMAELQKYVGDNLTDVNAYKKALDDKKKELEDRAKALAAEKASGALKEAQKNLPFSIPKF
jgi:hypothetical protein